MAADIACTSSNQYFFLTLNDKSALAICSWDIAPMVTSLANIYEIQNQSQHIVFCSEESALLTQYYFTDTITLDHQ